MYMGQMFLALLFNPLNVCYRASRFFFLNVLLHIICAPLYKVLILRRTFPGQMCIRNPVKK